MANDPAFLAGSIDAAAAEKMTRFVDLCDTFRLPVVNFVDNPGFLVGIEAEEQGTIRKGVRALAAVYQATVPWCSIIVRKAFGVAGAGHSNHTRSSPRYAWPSGEWGSLPIEGGVEAAYKRQLQAADDPDALRAELEEKLGSLRDPILTAEVFGVEEIIDPRDTRPLLVEFARRAYEIVESDARGPKAAACVRRLVALAYSVPITPKAPDHQWTIGPARLDQPPSPEPVLPPPEPVLPPPEPLFAPPSHCCRRPNRCFRRCRTHFHRRSRYCRQSRCRRNHCPSAVILWRSVIAVARPAVVIIRVVITVTRAAVVIIRVVTVARPAVVIVVRAFLRRRRRRNFWTHLR